MEQSIEKLYLKNLTRLELFISICRSFGQRYNPTRENLKIQHLINIKEKVQTYYFEMCAAKDLIELARKEQGYIYAQVKQLSYQIALSQEEKEQQEKKRGEEMHPASANPIKETSTASLSFNLDSQLRYNCLIFSYGKMVHTACYELAFQEEIEIVETSKLERLLLQLTNVNNDVIDAITNYNTALKRMKMAMSAPIVGLKDIVIDVKNYVKSVYGQDSDEYGQLCTIRFGIPPK